MRTREEHLDWCKERAREYLAQGDVKSAIASMMSDLDKHEETRVKNPALNMLGLLAAVNEDLAEARRFIEGFH
jgi:hypothetical protein